MNETPPLIEARRINKRFGPVAALTDAGVALRPGRVVAIVGENGAGKSTLAKIIAGVYRADSGEILVEGRRMALNGRRQAAALGIGFVPQSLSFIGTLSALDNHLLAGSNVVLERSAARRALREASAKLGVEANWDSPVETLSLAERQIVEIISAFAHGARALLLDEPTSALGPIEIERLIAALATLGRAGVAIGLVTHRVREVLEGAHDVTVLRQGEVVFSGAVTGLDGEAVARLMVGERARSGSTPARRTGAPRLAVANLTVADALKSVSLEVKAGEILGVAGVAGPAQPALAEAIAGLRPEAKGQVAIDGLVVTGRAAEARRRGLAYIPEDRAAGAPPDLAVSVVASLLHLGETTFTRFGLRRSWRSLGWLSGWFHRARSGCGADMPRHWFCWDKIRCQYSASAFFSASSPGLAWRVMMVPECNSW